jgi:biotin synthase
VRLIATARILMPRSYVRLSAGRLSLSDEAQALCFLAGANSVFLGDRLLTTPNPAADVDRSLFERLGLRLQCPEAPPLMVSSGASADPSAI